MDDALACRQCAHFHDRDACCRVLIPLPTLPGRGYECGCGIGVGRGFCREPIPIDVRRAVIERDGAVCTLCGCEVLTGRKGKRSRRRMLHLDHIQPWSMGGTSTIDNLRVTCATCNTRRGNRYDTPENIITRL